MAPLATALPTELLVSCLCFSSEGTIGLLVLMIQVNVAASAIRHVADMAHNHRFAPKEPRSTGCRVRGGNAATALPVVGAARPDSVFRFNRLSSARISAALWYRRSRSFSIAVHMISSIFGGNSGLS